jgi:hypothetical protein
MLYRRLIQHTLDLGTRSISHPRRFNKVSRKALRLVVFSEIIDIANIFQDQDLDPDQDPDPDPDLDQDLDQDLDPDLDQDLDPDLDLDQDPDPDLDQDQDRFVCLLPTFILKIL